MRGDDAATAEPRHSPAWYARAALPPFAVAASGAFFIAMMLVRSTQMPTLDTGIQPLLVFVAPVVLGAIAGAVSKERGRRLGFAAALVGAYLGLAAAPAIFDLWLIGDAILVIGAPGFLLGYAIAAVIGRSRRGAFAHELDPGVGAAATEATSDPAGVRSAPTGSDYPPASGSDHGNAVYEPSRWVWPP